MNRNTSSITFSFPFFTQLLTKFDTIASSVQSTFFDFQTPTMSSAPSAPRVHNHKLKGFMRSPFFLPGSIIILIVIILIIFMLSRVLSQPIGGSNTNDPRVAIDKPKAVQQINKKFNFPIHDDKGKTVSTIVYEIQDAELRDQIVVKAQPATAIQGRTFLIINLKITNNYTSSIQLNARDYVRLIVDDSSDKLAADIHNDPVEVQAISTKYTRLGFAIDDKKQKLVLQVGEITGPKTDIKLTVE